MKASPKLSICIVHWNSPEHLERCLSRIQQLSSETSFEVIVIDNGSLPYLIQGLEKAWSTVRWILNRNNLGLAVANNQAAKEAKGEYLLFLNPDVILTAEALQALVTLLDQRGEAGAASCVKVQPGKGAESIFRNYPVQKLQTKDAFLDMVVQAGVELFPNSKVMNQLKLNHAMKVFDLSCLHSEQPFEVDMVWGACCIVRRQAFHDIGGFDENFFYGAEDKDFCLRLVQCGWKIFFIPKVSVEHMKGVSISLWDIRARESIKTYSRLFLYRKHSGVARLILNGVVEFWIHFTRCLCDMAIRAKGIFTRKNEEREEKIGFCDGILILCVNIGRVLFERKHPVSLQQAFKV